ncbi:hypothetical protein FRC02_006898 [Tulasnella sp. 418]|nr:hypothetical protein FRC02_006898 [Tulasnella sp. 418]
MATSTTGIEEIAGTASSGQKGIVQQSLKLFHSDDNFSSELGRRIIVTEVNYGPAPGGDGTRNRMVGHVVTEVEVTKDMTNGIGSLHGGCGAFLVDVCTSAMLMLFEETGWRQVYTGVSSTLNMSYHAPAPIGTKLRIVSTSVAVGQRTANARCEIYDKARGTVIATGTHLKMKPSTPNSKL